MVSGANTFLQITSDSKGADSSVAVTDGSGALADTFGTATATAGLSRTLGSVVSAVNQAISADPTLQAAGLTASISGTALKLSSSNGTYFQLNAYGIGFATPTPMLDLESPAQLMARQHLGCQRFHCR